MNLGKLNSVFRSMITVGALVGPAAYILVRTTGTGEKIRKVVQEYTAIDMNTGVWNQNATFGGVIPRGWMPSIGLKIAEGLVSIINSVLG